jgi:hypothetical protein
MNGHSGRQALQRLPGFRTASTPAILPRIAAQDPESGDGWTDTGRRRYVVQVGCRLQ